MIVTLFFNNLLGFLFHVFAHGIVVLIVSNATGIHLLGFQ